MKSLCERCGENPVSDDMDFICDDCFEEKLYEDEAMVDDSNWEDWEE